MPESDAVYQHYVPQLHLRGFSSNPRPAKNALISVLDKDQGSIDEKRVARVAGEKQFNRVKGPDDRYTNSVEAWLGIVEHHAAPALERLISSGERPNKADRTTIAFYLALQSERTPLGLSAVQRVSDLVLEANLALWTDDRDAFAEMSRNAGIDEPAEEIEALRQRLSKPGYVELADKRTRALGLAMAITGKMSNIIAPQTWTLLHSEVPLLVGDHPTTHHDPEPPFHPWTEPAWSSSPTVESFIPLTSHVALKMTHPHRRTENDFDTGELTEAEAYEANLRGFGWSTRYVFAEEQKTLEEVLHRAQRDPGSVPQASHQHQVITADDRAFFPSEPNDQPQAWPKLLPRRGPGGEIELHRYRVVRNDRPEDVRAAVEWALEHEKRLHPGQRPQLDVGGPERYLVRQRRKHP